MGYVINNFYNENKNNIIYKFISFISPYLSLNDGCFVTGSSIWRMIKDVPLDDISDIDIFITSGSIYSDKSNKIRGFLSKYYTLEYSSFDPRYEGTIIIDDIKLTKGTGIFDIFNNLKIQIIETNKKSPMDILEQFDFTIVCGATDGNEILEHSDLRPHITNNILEFNDTYDRYNFNYKRLSKYLSYGFSPTPDVLFCKEPIIKCVSSDDFFVSYGQN